MRILVTLVFDADDVALFDLERWDINLTSVYFDVSVIHELPSLTARSRETGTVNDIVQSTLKHEQKVLAGDALLMQGFFEVISKLLFENEVNALYLLLFAKLLAIARKHLASSGAVLSGRVGSAFFDRT